MRGSGWGAPRHSATRSEAADACRYLFSFWLRQQDGFTLKANKHNGNGYANDEPPRPPLQAPEDSDIHGKTAVTSRRHTAATRPPPRRTRRLCKWFVFLSDCASDCFKRSLRGEGTKHIVLFCLPSPSIPLAPGFIRNHICFERTGRDSVNVPTEESAVCHSKTQLKLYR